MTLTQEQRNWQVSQVKNQNSPEPGVEGALIEGILGLEIPEQHIWLAALFEGEGCIVIYDKQTAKGTQYKRVFLQLNMTDEDVVNTFVHLTGATKPIKILPEPPRKPQWKTTIHKAETVEAVLTWMLPYLGNRRSAKAREALEVLKENRDAGSRRFT